MVGGWIDSAIGLFSPTAALKRAHARELLKRTQYAAAKMGIQGGHWNAPDARVNTVIAASIHTLRARARQLVRDMPAMSAAIDRIEQFTVGNGICLQGRIKDHKGKLDKKANNRIEDAWKRWCDEADVAGRLHFYEIQQLCCRSEVEVGEYCVVKTAAPRHDRLMPFCLSILEPDQLAGSGATPLPDNEIHQGVEYEMRTGKAVAYHFEIPQLNPSSKYVRVAAKDVILGFRTLRPLQLRGVTPLAPVLLLAHQLRDYLEAEIATAQKAARWLAFVTSQDPAATMSALGAFASPIVDTSTPEKYTMDMGHAIVDFLRTGEDVKIADHNRPGDSFEPFVKFILRTFAAAVGVTYELISGDYYDAKYTAARISRNDMLKGIKIRRGRLIRQLCEPVRREFMDDAAKYARVDMPGYRTDPAHWNRCVWMEPGMEQLDPLKEGRAETDAVAAKLRSPHEVLQARGRDPEQVLDEWAEWKQMLEERGFSDPSQPSPVSTNPAAIMEDQKPHELTSKVASLYGGKR